jgi:hypothetical protein
MPSRTLPTAKPARSSISTDNSPSVQPERPSGSRSLAFLALVVLAGAGYFGYRTVVAHRRAEAERKALGMKIAATRVQVERIARAEFTALKKSAPPAAGENDAWGRPIEVERSDGAWNAVRVTSAGPDGTAGTPDDIRAFRFSPVDFKKAGEAVGREAARFGLGAIKGLGQAVKEGRQDRKRGGDEKAQAL